MARIAGIDLPNKHVRVGLTYIYGIGDKYSVDICKDLNIPNNKRVNQLTDEEILKIREYIDKNYSSLISNLVENMPHLILFLNMRSLKYIDI